METVPTADERATGADKEQCGRPGQTVWSTLITVNLHSPCSNSALSAKGNKFPPLLSDRESRFATFALNKEKIGRNQPT